MANIEITTPQNIPIQYELATLFDRILAFMVDYIILVSVLYVVFIFFLIGIISSNNEVSFFFYIMWVTPVIFYSFISEVLLKGQTIGKKIMGIKIMRLDGKELEIKDLLIRWFFRLIDIILTSGSLAIILIGSTNKNQRLGDMISNTVVIKLKPNKSFQLDDILKIHEKKEYIIEYPEVVKLKEQEVLLIKETLDRYSLYKNSVHIKALQNLVDKICVKLQKKKKKNDHATFLKKIIEDYIICTR